ncbi:MAG: hypothetical protein ACI8PT_003873 [Gammaproteobacteria bacterium]|jgi:hypothetical protein
MSSAGPQLEVEKKPFLRALKSLRISIRARQKDEASLSFSSGLLSIRMLESVVSIPATGTWSGTAKVVARTLIPIVTFPPDPDPLPLRFVDDRFFIAGWSVNGIWQAEGHVEAHAMPDDATCVDFAALRRRYTDIELESSGLLARVRNAEQSIKVQVAQAARLLEEVGISGEDLQELIDNKIAKRAGD